MTTQPGEVLVDVVGSTMIITLNRAAKRNAVNRSMAETIASALDRLDDAANLATGVITGAGGTFCAGMDLTEFVRGIRPSLPGRGFAGLTERPPAKPLIAAVEGYAYAGGCEIALACDLIVAGSTAQFCIPEVKRGLIAAGGALLRLPHRVPGQIAAELALIGDPIDAARAYHFGLVNHLVDDGTARDAALELAGRIALNGPLAVLATKRILASSRDWSAVDAFQRQREFSEPVFDSADAIEGARAFTERRAPSWQGR